MLLCDIGNTTYHFFDPDSPKAWREAAVDFDPERVSGTVHYICVNPAVQRRLETLPNWIDLRSMIVWKNYYDTMGIDRIMACEAVENGVVVDAGSAITVDVVRGGRFEGGFISPGLVAYAAAYEGISPRLSYSFNFDMQLDRMPNNSRDALTYGSIGLLAKEVLRHGLPVHLTGGDGEKILPLFPGAVYDPLLLFRGMKKIITKAQPC
jgi:type III pantothenate kinase